MCPWPSELPFLCLSSLITEMRITSKKPPCLKDSQSPSEAGWMLDAWALSPGGTLSRQGQGFPGWPEDSWRLACVAVRRVSSLPSARLDGQLLAVRPEKRRAVSFLATRWRPPPPGPRRRDYSLTSSAASWPRSRGFSSGNRSSCRPAMVTSWSRSPGKGGRGG